MLNTAIQLSCSSFNPLTRSSTRESSMVSGLPGYCDDAKYVLDCWSKANRVETTNATEEFIVGHGISLENIAAQLMK